MTSTLEDNLKAEGELHIFNNPHKSRDITIHEYFSTVPVLREMFNGGEFSDELIDEIKVHDNFIVAFLFLPEQERVVAIHHNPTEALRSLSDKLAIHNEK